MSSRWFNTDFWTGAYVQSLPPYEKLVYVYLINYPGGNISGVFDDQPRRYSFDLGIEPAALEGILSRLESDGKIARFDGKLALIKWSKHQAKNPSVVEGIMRELGGLSPQAVYSLAQTGYSLPPGCLWKTLLTGYESDEKAPKTQPVPKGPPKAPQAVVPNLTLPNLTQPNLTASAGAGGAVPQAAGEWALTEPQLEELDRLFPWANVDNEYEAARQATRAKGVLVSNPMAYMKKRLSNMVK